MNRKSKPFWSRVDKNGPNGCWLWTGGRQVSNGVVRYGIVWIGGKSIYAHRASFEMVNGPIPNGLFVLHKCDNPPCVNPDHLFLGTNSDNILDLVSKGRYVSPVVRNPECACRGELHGRSRLTDDEVRDIRNLHSRGCGVSDLARRYGVGQSTIGHIVRGETWAHIA